MKRNFRIATLLMGMATVSFAFCACQEKAAEAENAEGQEQVEEVAPAKKKAGRPIGNTVDSLSYAYGVGLADNIVQNIESMPFDFNKKVFIDAFVKSFNGQLNKLKLTPDEALMVFQSCAEKLMLQKAQENKKEAADFLKENATRSGVTTTASGLQYEVIEEGTGETPKATDRVKVDYHGTLLDGTVFDSSIERGNPAQFGVNQVIKGWQEGLQLMKEGAKYKFYIPSDLAYGDQGAGDKIAPGSMLIFEVTLIEIIRPEAPAKKK